MKTETFHSYLEIYDSCLFGSLAPVGLLVSVFFAICFIPTLVFASSKLASGDWASQLNFACTVCFCLVVVEVVFWVMLVFFQAILYEALMVEDVREFESFMKSWKGEPSIRQSV